MFVNLPSWLSALRTVSAAQLKAMYDAIATVVNGNITQDNFALGSNIKVARKTAPRSWFALEGQLYHPFAGDGGYGNAAAAGSGPSVLRWLIPEGAPANRKGTMKVGNWGAWLGGTDGANVTAGTVKLRHTPKSTGVTGDKDTFALTNGDEQKWLFSRDCDGAGGRPAEFEVSPGDVLEVQVTGVTYNGGTRILGFGAVVWLRMNHLP